MRSGSERKSSPENGLRGYDRGGVGSTRVICGISGGSTATARSDKGLGWGESTREPEPGDDVVCRVGFVYKDHMEVTVEAIIEASFPIRRRTGIVTSTDASNHYIENMSDVYRPGQTLRARIVKGGEVLSLTTRMEEYGIVLAECTNCGSYLVRTGSDILTCRVCGTEKKGKVACDYGRWSEKKPAIDRGHRFPYRR